MDHGVAANGELARWVDAFWSADGVDREHRILPDGCIDFLFDLNRGEGFVVGPMSRAEIVAIPRGVRLFGVRFAPGRGCAFVDANLHALEDGTVPLGDLTVAGAFHLAERVALASTDAERRRLVGQFLLDPRTKRRAIDPRVGHATKQFAAGGATVMNVAKATGVSERTLERLFRDHVGITPKLYARIMRMQAARRRGPRHLAQADLAAHSGYADEAHLVREFRDLTGLTAKALLDEERVGFVQVAATTSA